MRLEGQTEIAASRDRVWRSLVDPNEVAACIPGRPQVEIVDATHFRTRVPVGGGFLRTTAVIDVELQDLVEPSRVGASAHGSAMGGGATAAAAVALDDLGPGSTRVRWAAEVTLSGMAAGLAGMVEKPAGSAIDDTIACLKAKLETAEASEAADTGGAAADSAARNPG